MARDEGHISQSAEGKGEGDEAAAKGERRRRKKREYRERVCVSVSGEGGRGREEGGRPGGNYRESTGQLSMFLSKCRLGVAKFTNLKMRGAIVNYMYIYIYMYALISGFPRKFLRETNIPLCQRNRNPGTRPIHVCIATFYTIHVVFIVFMCSITIEVWVSCHCPLYVQEICSKYGVVAYTDIKEGESEVLLPLSVYWSCTCTLYHHVHVCVEIWIRDL